MNPRQDAIVACLRSASCTCKTTPTWRWIGDSLVRCACGALADEADIQMAVYAAMTPEERRAAADAQPDPHDLLDLRRPTPTEETTDE